MISTILVPHDGTEMSDKAFGKAVELAKALGSSLILLHVLRRNLCSISNANTRE
jgi:nucleotide-binding universal stress UspA family protein